jgi:hypothetical protein
MKDPIKLYFMDKIQSLILRFNKCQTNKEKNKKESPLDIPLHLFKESELSPPNYFEIRKEYRQKEMIRDDLIKDNLKKSTGKLEKHIEEYETKSKFNSRIIKDGLDNQKSCIEQKLKERRESKSMNRSYRSQIKQKSELSVEIKKQKSITNIRLSKNVFQDQTLNIFLNKSNSSNDIDYKSQNSQNNIENKNHDNPFYENQNENENCINNNYHNLVIKEDEKKIFSDNFLKDYLT